MAGSERLGIEWIGIQCNGKDRQDRRRIDRIGKPWNGMAGTEIIKKYKSTNKKNGLMKKNKYRSTGNSPLTDKKAQLLGSFIEKNFPDQKVSPHELVEKAKPKNSPIHNLFEWDNTVAGEKWRAHQARMYLACVVVVTTAGDSKAYFNVTVTNGERTYVSSEKAMSEADLWQQVIEDALAELVLWRRRYESYKQLKPMHKVIDQTLIKIRKKI